VRTAGIPTLLADVLLKCLYILVEAVDLAAWGQIKDQPPGNPSDGSPSPSSAAEPRVAAFKASEVGGGTPNFREGA